MALPAVSVSKLREVRGGNAHGKALPALEKRALASVLFTLLCFLANHAAVAAAEKCETCGGAFGASVYLIRDEIAGQKKEVCPNCATVLPRCSTCGLPIPGNGTELPDGRFICRRDSSNAVLELEEARRFVDHTKAQLDRLFSRFLSFPDTNVDFALVDRVNLQQLFKFPGHDYTCPNVWGYLQTLTNDGRLHHELSILSGLPADSFKAVLAHEYSHAWLNENLPERRTKSIHGDAIEGFCELVAFVLMEAQNEERQKKLIQLNAYTRGQIHLFIDAYNRFGLDDIVEWMKHGRGARLSADNLVQVRDLDGSPTDPRPESSVILTHAEPPPVPDRLMLKGIIWSTARPTALINDRSFQVREEGKVRVGKTNLTIRCLAIGRDSVQVQVLDSGAVQELRLTR